MNATHAQTVLTNLSKSKPELVEPQGSPTIADALPPPFAATPPFGLALPPGLVMWEQAGRMLRSFLKANGLDAWHCFFREKSSFDDIDEHLEQLQESSAVWTPLGPFSPDGHPLAQFDRDDDDSRVTLQKSGCLWLRRHQAVICRWFHEDGRWHTHFLFAAASAECFERLCRELKQLHRSDAPSYWRYVFHHGIENRRREADTRWEDLVLPASVRQRLQTEVIDFFSAPAAAMYRELKIPYRRGVLLHGAPGNGKTSIIRALGAMNLRVAATILRPGRDFDDEDFARAIDHWVSEAPSILVIEDLDWLLPRLNLSTFLNHIDGIETKGDGLLVIATTNHPEELDPAVNNRPGRFDVVIEVPTPLEAHRLEYVRRSSMARLGEALLTELAATTDGLSFAHLREIESMSGLMAVRVGRSSRTADDVREAARRVIASHAEARRGFPGRKKPAGFEINRGED